MPPLAERIAESAYEPKNWGGCYTEPSCGPYGGIDCNSNRFCRKKRRSARIWHYFIGVVLTFFAHIVIAIFLMC